MASLYVIAIGGTGAKCAEAIVHAVAAGLFTPNPIKDCRVKILLIDPDEANGNVQRASETIKIYQSCHNLFQDSTQDERSQKMPWMSMPIEFKEIWSPFGTGNRTLADFVNYPNYRDKPLGSLLGTLYSESERQANLDVGFRGRPAIGSAVMSKIDFSQDRIWRSLMEEIKNDCQTGTPKIFLCGSIFGGTGASGFPTIGKLVWEELKNTNAKLGGLLMLPYFQFSVPPNQSQTEIYARPEDFLLKTEAALRYYLGQAEETFNTIYLLGDSELVDVKNFSIGQADQRNDPHFLELYAALAARHFWLTDPSEEKGTVALMARHEPGKISWDDIPKREINSVGNDLDAKEALVGMTRFAFAWTAGITVDLQEALRIGIKNFQKGQPWFSLFFRPETLFGKDESVPELKPEEEKLQIINRWSENFLTWLALIHYSQLSANTIQLFKANQFADRDGRLHKDINTFSNLVFDTAEKGKKERDTFGELKMGLTKNLKNQLGSPNVGAVGLAKALYQLSKPR